MLSQRVRAPAPATPPRLRCRCPQSEAVTQEARKARPRLTRRCNDIGGLHARSTLRMGASFRHRLTQLRARSRRSQRRARYMRATRQFQRRRGHRWCNISVGLRRHYVERPGRSPRRTSAAAGREERGGRRHAPSLRSNEVRPHSNLSWQVGVARRCGRCGRPSSPRCPGVNARDRLARATMQQPSIASSQRCSRAAAEGRLVAFEVRAPPARSRAERPT